MTRRANLPHHPGLIAAASLVALVAACLILPVGARAAGATFVTTGLPMPADAAPGADSGYSDFRPSGSPLSANGRYVAFQSDASFQIKGVRPDETNVFRKDRKTGKVVLVSRRTGPAGAGSRGRTGSVTISGDGNLVGFTTTDQLVPADTDLVADFYIRNVATNVTTLESPGTDLEVGDGSISADGSYAVFDTTSVVAGVDVNNKPDVFRRRLSDGTTDLVSRIPASATAGDNLSFAGGISGDGRWVSFTSGSSDLVTPFTDTNGAFTYDVFVRDMTDGSTYLVSSVYNDASTTANGGSGEPVVAGSPASAAEVKLSFSSNATDLAPPGTDGATDYSVYTRGLTSPASTLVSLNSGGENANSRAHTPSISNDGKRLVFTSDATNLGGPDTYYGVYLRNLVTNQTSLVSARNEYAVFGSLSADGRVAAWAETGATRDADPFIEGIFARTLPKGKITMASSPAGGKRMVLPGAGLNDATIDGPQLSQNGRYGVLTVYTNRLPGYRKGFAQTYRRDLKTGEWTLVSRATGKNGSPAETGSEGASISNDGNRVLFLTRTSLVPIDTDNELSAYIRDLKKATTSLVSRADGASGANADQAVNSAVISGGGNRVAFSTYSTNLGAPGGQEQVYLRDLAGKKTLLVSRADGEAGAAGNGDSGNPELSDNGQLVVFDSLATNLHPDDADPNRSIFVRHPGSGSTVLASRRPGLTGANATDTQSSPDISGNGRFVAWRSGDPDTAPEAGPWPIGTSQVVLRDLNSGENSLISRGPGSGPPGELGGASPSLNRNGSVIAFATNSANLISGLGGADRPAVMVRNLASGGQLSGPPAFGEVGSLASTGSLAPSISANGKCLAFVGLGYSKASGVFNDLRSGYVFAPVGGCPKPPAGGPTISAASMKPAAFPFRSKQGGRIRFRLDRKATVTFLVERKVAGRKVGDECHKVRPWNAGKPGCTKLVYIGRFTRRNLPAGVNVVRFRARVGKKRLGPGRYRLRLRAADRAGNSRFVPLSFRLTRR